MHRQVAGNVIDISLIRFLHSNSCALETDHGELVGIKTIGAAQMDIAFFVVGVNARGIDIDLELTGSRIGPVEPIVAAHFIETTIRNRGTPQRAIPYRFWGRLIASTG